MRSLPQQIKQRRWHLGNDSKSGTLSGDFGLRVLAVCCAIAFLFCVGDPPRAARAAEPEKHPAYPATLSGGAPCGSCTAPANLSWKTVIPPENEPGEPLVITGRVFQHDGKTPAQGMVLWVYQTDRTGYYNEKDDASHPRLNGWMKIGADGKYEFRTIRPGAYPHRTTPAHIHAHVYGPGFSERSIEDYWFKDDPRINEKELKLQADNGEHPVIVEVKRGADGVWRGVRDITMPATK